MAHYQYEGQHFQLPDGLSNEEAIGKIKTHLGQATGFTPATIPGQEGEAERVAGLKAARKAQPGEEKLKDILGGVGETALSLGTSMYAGVQAPITAGMKRAVGMVPDWEKETARLMEENTYAPRTEKGQEYTAAFGDVANRYLAPFGLSGVRAMAGLPDLVGRAKLKNKMGKEPIAPETIPVDREALIRGPQAAPAAEPPQTNGITQMADQLTEGWNTPYRPDVLPEVKSQNAVGQVAEQLGNMGEQQRAAKAQETLALRQAAMEQEVARQTSLDQNAANRARQGSAPTGFEAWRDAQQQSAEQRLPGDNTPLEFTNETSPYGLQDSPVGRGGMDFSGQMAEDLARPLEQRMQRSVEEQAAWDQRNLERSQEQAQQELRQGALEDPSLIAMEDQLRAEQYKPTGDGQGPKTRAANAARLNRFGQGGAISPEVLKEGFTAVTRALSALTDQPWVRARFPSNEWMTNPDGSPKIQLHGTKQFIEGELRAGEEGFHSGYTSSPHMFAGLRTKPLRESHPKTSVRSMDYTRRTVTRPEGGQLYPIAIKNGNYPHIKEDFGSWEPRMLANKDRFALTLSKESKGAYDFYQTKEILNNFLVNQGEDTGAADLNRRFSKMLKDNFNIDGFTYVNKYESVPAELRGNAAHRGGPSGYKDSLNRANRYADPESFVTWNEDNYRSVFNDPKNPSTALRSQRGNAPMIGDLAEGIVKVGRGLKAKFTGVVPPQPDTILTPRSPATIAAKVEKGSKAAAIGMRDSPYISPSTIEEVVANPGKDISRVTQEMGAGMYAAIRRNSPNRMMAFSNRVLTDARLNKIKDSVQYITGKEGYNNKLTKLSPKEKMIIHQDSLIFDREAIPFTHEKAVELGYTPAMEVFMNQRMASNGRVLELGNKVNAKQGLKLIDPRVSYAAANFDGAYRTLVGKWHGEGKNREFKIDTVVNGNSYWELRQGEAWARENVPGAEFLELPRRGLNKEPTKEFKGVQQDSMSRLLSELAGMDPKFADAKAAIDAHIQAQTKKLYGHDKHAIEKKGVRGAIGNRPWLDAERNASDFFKQEVNHIEEGLQYWNYQDAINDIRSMTARPELGHMKNTIQYIDKYLQNIHGQGLNAFGAAINTVVDAVFASTGFGSASTSKGVMNAAREAASLWMMGMFNTAFPVIQLSQFLTGMAPEAVRIRSEFGLSPTTVATSLGNSTFSLSLIAAADLMGKSMDAFPSHLVDAYKWAKEHGITQYNEVEQSHSATQSPKWSKVKDIAGLPISVPERITGPQTFMWAVDMLHEAGLRGDDLHRAAYNASKYAMTEYHPDEAPLVYQRLGVAGPNIGGLKKFVHNSIDQQFARYGEAFKHPAAASTVLGMTLLTAGATGLMGTAMLDKASLNLTDKGLRDHWDDMMGTSKASQGVRDGFTSVLTGFDVQSRYSLADVVPGSFAEAVAGPHLSMLGKTIIAIHQYAKHRDEQSFWEMAKAATPSGMKGMLEEGYLLGEQGQVLDKNAMNKYPPEMNRTDTEHKVRQWGGPKPLRERLYDEQKYQADVVQQRIEKKRREAVTRLTASMGLKDEEGFKKALTEFIKAEGDVSTLDQSIQKYYEQQMLSSKQRAGGLEPKPTIPSIKKWERYQEKQ